MQSGYCGVSRNSRERRCSTAARGKLVQQRNISSSDRAAGVHLAAKQAQELQLIPMQAWRFHKVFAIKLRVQSNLTRQCTPKMNR